MGFAVFAVALLLFRMVVALFVVMLRVIAVMFFIPIWIARPRRQRVVYLPSPGRRGQRVATPPPGTFLRDLTGLIRELKTPAGVSPALAPIAARSKIADPPDEPSRNEVDCVRALTELGVNKKQAERVTAQASSELGRSTALNDLIKRSLQLIGRPT